MTPGVGFRETFYSNSLRPGVDPAVEDPISATNIHREYFQFTMDLAGWGLSRIYSNSSGSDWKHLIEPLVRYRYIAGIDDFDRVIRFDEQDAVANTHEIEYALLIASLSGESPQTENSITNGCLLRSPRSTSLIRTLAEHYSPVPSINSSPSTLSPASLTRSRHETTHP